MKKIENIASVKDVIRAKGLNIFFDFRDQNPVYTLALKSRRRSAFFQNKPKLLELLRKDIENPVLEEGEANGLEDRERAGEYFITFDALKMLIKNKITDRPNSSGKYFNKENILLFRDDVSAFSNALVELNLKEGEDAKFIYVNKIHGIAGYLRNVRGEMHCFIVDSQPDPGFGSLPVMRALVRAFDRDIKTILSSTTLQKDYYSCITFAYKALLYFVKHGPEVFPYLNHMPLTYDERSHWHVLPEDKLMPVLLKMSHTRFDLSKETLDTLVSVNAGMTLSQYWDKYCIQGKYNAAALIKKYGYFSAIHKEMMELEAGVSNVTKIKR